MRKTVAYALDFILDTLDYSPDEPSVPTGEADLRLQPSADPMMKDQFCVVLWNDEKHSFDDAIKLLMDTTNRTREEANDTAVRIDEQGRDIIEMHAGAARLLETARTFSQIDLGVTVRRAYDTFREQISAVMIEWILDLTQSRFGADTFIMREVIASQLLAPRKPCILNPNPAAQKILAEVDSPARLDYMFLYDTRLWKRPRLDLKELYTSIMILSHEYELAVGEPRVSLKPVDGEI
jgi:E3 ubiquitin-protein ligase UBR1